MPYSKSAARKDFEAVITNLIKLSRHVSISKCGYNADIKQGIYKSAIFQSSAALEEYIKSVFEDWIYLLHTNNKKLKHLPAELIYCLVGKRQLSTFRNFVVNSNEGELINSLSNIKLLPKLFNENEDVKGIVYQNEVIADKKYPSIKNISVICKRFGIKDIFNAMNIVGKKDYKLIISSFNDVRTEIAHQHPSPDLAVSSVVDNLKALLGVVDKMDRVLYSHIRKTSGENCWLSQSIAPPI